MIERVDTAFGRMRGRCWTLDTIMGAPDIALDQQGKDRFRVTYGQQVKAGLTYSQAATELGACIMHALACDGRLDNRARGEP